MLLRTNGKERGSHGAEGRREILSRIPVPEITKVNLTFQSFFNTPYFITFSKNFPFFLSTDNHTLTELHFFFKFGKVSN